MDAERELTARLLSKDANFRLITELPIRVIVGSHRAIVLKPG